MSHITVMVISKDCTSVMNNLTGDYWDWWDEDNEQGKEIGGEPIDEFLTIGDLRKAWNNDRNAVIGEIGAVVEYGNYTDANESVLKQVLDAYDDGTWIKLYDAHQ